jgi:hypothetical protein
MKLNWKRTLNNKKLNLEVEYLLTYKINGEVVTLPRIYLEKDYLQDDVKSVVEEFLIDKQDKTKKTIQDSLNLDEKTRVRNHFRNVCFRKKFNTLNEHIKYIADYYALPELSVYDYVSDDLPIIKKQVGLH